MRVVHFDRYGEADVLKVINALKPKPKDDQVLIRVSACGVNREDVWRRKGCFDYPIYTSLALGHECSGYIVEKVVRGGGAYGEYVVVPASTVVRYPMCISSEQAASLPQAVCLVLYCFRVLRQITDRQTVLIHGAGGGVGVLALQYAAKAIGCDVIVTVGTDEKMIRCKELGAKDCINRKKGDFCKIVKTITKGTALMGTFIAAAINEQWIDIVVEGDTLAVLKTPRKLDSLHLGVDVILDVNGGKCLDQNLDCLAKGGSLFIIGLDITVILDVDLSILRMKDAEIIGASLFLMRPSDIAGLLHRAEATIWPLIENGQIQPVVGKTFTFSDAASAHRAMENYSIFGKVILIPDPEDSQKE